MLCHKRGRLTSDLCFASWAFLHRCPGKCRAGCKRPEAGSKNVAHPERNQLLSRFKKSQITALPAQNKNTASHKVLSKYWSNLTPYFSDVGYPKFKCLLRFEVYFFHDIEYSTFNIITYNLSSGFVLFKGVLLCIKFARVIHLVAIDDVIVFDGIDFGHWKSNSEADDGCRESLRRALSEDVQTRSHGSLVPDAWRCKTA